MSRKKNTHNVCEAVGGEGEQRVLLRKQNEEKEPGWRRVASDPKLQIAV